MRLVLPILALLAACEAPDPTDLQQPFYGIDSDADGLSDGEEQDLGTDPLQIDTDGDTYEDGHEVWLGHNPTHPADRIYRGYWPYWHEKDSLGNRPLERGVEVGKRLPRFTAPDHHGDLVDIYDFGGPDQDHAYLWINVCTAWCSYCPAMESWISGGDDSLGLEDDYRPVRRAIDKGTLAYATLLTQPGSYEPAQVEDALDYHERHPHRNVPVLADPDGTLQQFLGQGGGWPMAILVDTRTMRVVDSGLGVNHGLDAALATLDP